MRQRIENKQETKLSEVAVTVMLHDRRLALGGNDSFLARASSVRSLSGSLAVRFRCDSSALSPSGWVNASPERRRARCRSLSRSEKFPAEGPMARSALAVLVANQNTRSPKAVATPITSKTEQRRCFAA